MLCYMYTAYHFHSVNILGVKHAFSYISSLAHCILIGCRRICLCCCESCSSYKIGVVSVSIVLVVVKSFVLNNSEITRQAVYI
jgi:hypothetical protein